MITEEAVQEVAKPEKEEDPEPAPSNYAISDRKFANVIGLEYEKATLRRKISNPLRHEGVYEDMGKRKGCGIIVYGPPGVGKTLLLEASSGEFQVPMRYLKASQVLTKYVGEPEQKVAEVFREAVDNEPCILLIDEIDSLVGSRDGGDDGTSKAMQLVTTSFLTEVGELLADPLSRVFLVGATNRAWEIDDAMKRGGRFETLIYVRPPGLLQRRRLLQLYMGKGKPHVGRVEWLLMALALSGYSPADIMKVCEAATDEVIEEINKTGKATRLTTKHLRRAIRDRKISRSSLDEWYLNMKYTYIGPQQQRRGRMPWNWMKTKPVGKEPKFRKDQLQTYADMVQDVNHYVKWRSWMRIVRFLAKGL